MSLLQEMEKFGLADCEQNRKILKEDETIKKILSLSDCIEDHLIIIHTTENKDLIKLSKKAIKKMEHEIEKLRGEL